MAWYLWLLLAVGATFALAAIGIRTLRLTRRGRRFLALPTRAKLRFGRALLGDRRTGWMAKAVLVLLVGYLAMPFDLIPDFVPVLGQADDVLVIVLALWLLMVVVPRERFEAALAEAEGSSGVTAPE